MQNGYKKADASTFLLTEHTHTHTHAHLLQRKKKDHRGERADR